MGIKNKVLGVIAAAGLTLGVVGSVVAADVVDGEVVLAAGDCSFTVESGEFDFGTWTWNGDAYVPDTNDGESVVQGKLITPQPRSTCNLTVDTTGLKK